jgi:hypothetical protein
MVQRTIRRHTLHGGVRMSITTILQSWIIAFPISIVVAALAYSLASSGQGIPSHSFSAWLLWPGVALYTAINGSLLFGGGFGTYGNAALIILSSAAAGSVSLVAIVLGFSWFRRSQRHH